MKVAVEGCCHGQLDAIYDHIHALESQHNYKVDLLLICGDFKAIRNYADLQCMAVPIKYKELGGFYKYYTGERTAPILTVVIGGNHEASNYMWELYHGGWLAPNIYFLGHAGCVRVNGIRIAGASGIFKSYHFRQGSYEQLPYTPDSLRSIYHIREFNVRRLSLLSRPNVFLSHDWPQSIEHHGDLRSLLEQKSHFEQQVNDRTLGSPPLMGLLRTLKPDWWFAAHMYTRYEAVVVHESPSDGVGNGGGMGAERGNARSKAKNPVEIAIDNEGFGGGVSESKSSAAVWNGTETSATVSPAPAAPKQNPDETTLDDEEDTVEAPLPPLPPRVPTSPQGLVTRFLALDQCLPERQFLEVVDIPIPTPAPKYESTSAEPGADAYTSPVLEFDPGWLAITRAFHPWFSTTRRQRPFPGETEARATVATAMQWVVENLQKNDPTLALPVHDVQTFAPTAPGLISPSPDKHVKDDEPQPPAYSNPQTEAFCRMLGIKNKINPGAAGGSRW